MIRYMCMRASRRQIDEKTRPTKHPSRQRPSTNITHKRKRHNHQQSRRQETQTHKSELAKPAWPHRRDVPNSKKPARDRCRFWKPSNYKDSIRYGHITLEEPLQHDHIRAHSRIEETNNVCAGLKCTSPCMPIVLLSANLSKLR